VNGGDKSWDMRNAFQELQITSAGTFADDDGGGLGDAGLDRLVQQGSGEAKLKGTFVSYLN
jgi:hypothetical protein